MKVMVTRGKIRGKIGNWLNGSLMIRWIRERIERRDLAVCQDPDSERTQSLAEVQKRLGLRGTKSTAIGLGPTDL
jgi:hypothetical protein